MTYYDLYGQRRPYKSARRPKYRKTFVDWTKRNGEFRYMLWIHYSPSDGVAMRKTFDSFLEAKRYAGIVEALGFGAEIADRMIRRGESGFVAGDPVGNTRGYVRDWDGTLEVGPWEEMTPKMDKLREEKYEMWRKKNWK